MSLQRYVLCAIVAAMATTLPMHLAALENTPVKESRQSIDSQIATLQEQKKQLESRLFFAQSDADRIMFSDWMGYQRRVREIKFMQAQLDQVNAQLDALQKIKGKTTK